MIAQVPGVKGVKTSQFPQRQWGLHGIGAAAVLVLAACASVPGETLAPFGVRRDVSEKVLARANQGAPGCKRVKIVDTEVLEVHGNGKVASERWVVDRCDERVNFRVSFPPTGNPAGVQVRPE